MTHQDRINIKQLQQIAEDSTNSETYQPLDKTKHYRIGVGARATSPPPSFFIEVIINLSDESKRVDLPRLKKALVFLRMLDERGYSLFYESDNCISCETKTDSAKINQEYIAVKTLIEATLI
jgi:hypothetical protein